MANREKVLREFRAFFGEEGLNLFVVSSTDEYLNEYVSLESNSRYLLTGFSGSTGDAIVTNREIFLFVDGRYHLQAEKEVNHGLITLVKTGLDKSPQKALYEKIAELSGDKANIGIVSSKTSCSAFKYLLKNLEGKHDIKIVEYEHDPLINNLQKQTNNQILRYISSTKTGETSEQKLARVIDFNDKNDINFLLITNLADIAYLTNLRGQEIPYSSCFRSKAVVFKGKAYIFMNLENITPEIRRNFSEKFVFKPEGDFEDFINEISKTENVYYHLNSTPLAVFRKVEKLSDKVVEMKESFISGLKAVKTPSELDYMGECALSADIVISRAICWLAQNLEKGMEISEKDFSDKVKEFFFEENACALSFEPITASGKNTAIIHYTDPNPQKFIQKDDLILLDCGAFFEGGYATDATRTFLAGGNLISTDAMQKQVYTVVLKGFLRGINFDLGGGKSGFDLDKAVREVIEANKPKDFSFSHATGHGIGISVHESPPGIFPSELAKTSLKAGMCFTVEPGLYNETWGGVRIENTVKVFEEDGKLRIKTLTRAGLDENLINYDMLSDEEKVWLAEYQKGKIG